MIYNWLLVLWFASISPLFSNERDDTIAKIEVADARFEQLREQSKQLLSLRKEATKDPEEMSKEHAYQNEIKDFFEAFIKFREEGANLASADTQDGFQFYAYAYNELTNNFVTFVETNLFLRGWEEILKKPNND